MATVSCLPTPKPCRAWGKFWNCVCLSLDAGQPLQPTATIHKLPYQLTPPPTTTTATTTTATGAVREGSRVLQPAYQTTARGRASRRVLGSPRGLQQACLGSGPVLVAAAVTADGVLGTGEDP